LLSAVFPYQQFLSIFAAAACEHRAQGTGHRAQGVERGAWSVERGAWSRGQGGMRGEG